MPESYFYNICRLYHMIPLSKVSLDILNIIVIIIHSVLHLILKHSIHQIANVWPLQLSGKSTGLVNQGSRVQFSPEA